MVLIVSTTLFLFCNSSLTSFKQTPLIFLKYWVTFPVRQQLSKSAILREAMRGNRRTGEETDEVHSKR